LRARRGPEQIVDPVMGDTIAGGMGTDHRAGEIYRTAIATPSG